MGQMAGQNFDLGNQWYKNNPNRTFIKLVVEQEGIYRLSRQDLSNAGFDLTGVDPKFLQMYHRGKEIPIFVTQSNGQLNYVEFYGNLNDGRVDSIMYRDPTSGVHSPKSQPNIHRSIYTDKSAYFLTWSQSQPGRRYFDHLDLAYSQLPAESVFPYRAFIDFKPEYPTNNPLAGIHVIGGGGPYDSFHSLNTDFVTGEGIISYKSFSYKPQNNTPTSFRLNTPAAANNGQPFQIEARVFARSNTEHHLRMYVNGNTSTPLVDSLIEHFSIYTHTYTREHVTNLSATTDLDFHALRAPTDNNHLCWAAITYLRKFDMINESTVKITGWDKSSRSHFRFSNAPGTDSVFAYDLSSGVRSRGLMTSSNTAEVIVFSSNNPRRDIFIATDKGILKPEIEAASLSKLHDRAQGAEFVIISNRQLSASAEAYYQYRDTCTANPMSIKLVYVEDIFDEYGYGSHTPWAIKRFCKDALDNWQTKPRFFLFLGKGRTWNRGFDDNLVPTFGYPASDHEFVGHYDQNSTDITPGAAVGRVNVYDDDEGFAYLNKVKEYEYTPFEPWMKRAVFLGGGATPGEQSAIKNAFTFFINKFENGPYGGDPIYFQKSTQGIDQSNNAPYHAEISRGVSMVHFFGHSSSNLLDINISEAFEYNNYGRYPIMLAMGCYGGDFAGRESFGERWVKEPERGCIAYLANSSAGYLNPLRDYGRVLYPFRFEEMLDKPFGLVVQRTTARYADSLPGVQYRNHARQMNLQGDPAIRLYYPKKADLAIDQSGVFFTPPNFTSQDDSFQINLIVRNEGLAVADSFDISISQLLPDRTEHFHGYYTFPMVKNRDTLAITLFNPAEDLMAGENRFNIFVDARDSIAETDENNNQVWVDRIIPGNIPATLYPTEYAIVGKNQVHLDASAFFMTRDEKVRYLFEIDTNHEFTSPAKRTSSPVEGNATYARWDVPFTLADSQVYYWRVRLMDVEPSIWGTSSFKYIANRDGWAQSQAPQFIKDESERVELNLIQQSWDFDLFSRNYTFEIFPKSDPRVNQFTFSFDNANATDINMGGGFLYYTVISKDSLKPTFSKVPVLQRMRLIGDIDDELYQLRNVIRGLKDGDYVILAGAEIPNISTWPEEFFDIVEDIGGTSAIRNLPNGGTFLIMGKNNFPASAIEVLAPNSGVKYKIDEDLKTPLSDGKILSTLIGPALNWEQMFWGWKSLDKPVREEIQLQVVGIRNNNTDTLFISGAEPGNSVDLSMIDAKRFPYLRLQAYLKDSVNRTAPQLDNWHVLFLPAPDAVVDPLNNFAFESDTVQEGQDIYIRMGALNVSDLNMDSLKVKFSAIRPDRNTVTLDSIRIAPLPAGGRLEFEYTFNTLAKKLEGDVSLVVAINPDNDQPERHTFNNTYIQPFHVLVDKLNPILDVTFDGKRIIDGDIVSPRPEILIQVNDENPYIAMNDTSNFEVYFYESRPGESPNSNNRVAINSNNPLVEWRPANLPENKAEVLFRPGFVEALEDGEYVLAVQGRDQKGNSSGNNSYYQISFKVINEATITHVVNYPNPFSTSTRFVYTLTGQDIPTKFQIHIFTVAGKLVKVIDLLAEGDVAIGQNITNYAWDGTDQYGDPLGNGVYLYRVVLESAGDNHSLRDEGTSQYFNKGWGKMYLMR